MKTPETKANQVTNQIVPAADVPALSLEIRLDPQRAAGWLVCTEELLAGCDSEELRQFHSLLSDACWLARWKREEAIIEFNPLWLPGLVCALASDAAKLRCRACAIEDILATLSRCRSY